VRSNDLQLTDSKLPLGVLTQNELDPALVRKETVAGANWLAKLRYDRFFTERNALYLQAFAGQDIIAGKTAAAGRQGCYIRLLVKSDMHELAAEIGYDFSGVVFSAPNTDPVAIHSGRLFLGYLLTVSKATAINASVEAFVNGNEIIVGPKEDPNSKKGFGE